MNDLPDRKECPINGKTQSEYQVHAEPNGNVAPTSSEDLENTTPANTPIYTGGYDVCCDPKSVGHKGIFLVLLCSIGFGSYFCYDNPGALQVIIVMRLNNLELTIFSCRIELSQHIRPQLFLGPNHGCNERYNNSVYEFVFVLFLAECCASDYWR